MDTAAARWFVRVEIDEQWELVQAGLLDHPVEAVVEGSSEARVYFAALRDAETFAAQMAPGEAVEQDEQGGEDRALVFGNENHPTTLLCLELMGAAAGPMAGLRVADVGSGTGVLAAAARRAGARLAVGADIDAPAARATRDATAGMAVQGGPECLAAGMFDLTVVNLHLAALRGIWKELVRLAAPVMVVSGLLPSQAAEVETLAHATGWRCQIRQQREGWMGLVFVATAANTTTSSSSPFGSVPPALRTG